MFIDSGNLSIAEELPVCNCANVTVANCCDNNGRQVIATITIIKMLKEVSGLTISL